MIRYARLTAAISTVVAAPFLHAQSEPATSATDAVEEVMVIGQLGRYSATKSDTPILETARSVSIETALDLRDKGALNVADAYLYSAGVFGERYGFATRGDWVSVRGLDVPEYRDSLQALFGNYNNTRPDIYTIEQVEVLKGPASVLYGQGSPGGIVNVVSKTPRSEPFRELVVEGGSFDRRQVAADMTGPLDEGGQWLYRVNAVYRDTDTQVDHVGEEALVFAPSLTWAPDERTRVTALLNLQETDSDTGSQFHQIDGTLRPAPDGSFIDRSTYTGEPGFNRYDTENRSVTLLADRTINSTWTVEGTARYTEGESDYRQAWVSFFGGDRWVYDESGELYRGGMVPRTFYVADNMSEQFATDLRARASFTTGAFDHELMIGSMFQDVTTDTDTAYLYALGYDAAAAGPDEALGDRFWINPLDPVYSGNIPDRDLIDNYFNDTPASTTRDTGFYINDQITAGNWNLLLGLRHDRVETDNGATVQDDDATSYSVGVLYSTDIGLSPYVSYAESFEPVVGTDNITGEALKPRDGEQVEAGIKYQPGNSGAFLTLAWFDIEESNLSNPNAIVGANSQQEGVSTVNGVEFEAFVPVGDFRWETNLSRVETENPDGYRFASVPEDQASTWISYRPGGDWQGFKAGAGLRYVGESWGGADTLRTPSYTLADLMIGYGREAWQMSLNVTNLGDKEYQATCLARGDCFPGEARSVVARFVQRF